MNSRSCRPVRSSRHPKRIGISCLDRIQEIVQTGYVVAIQFIDHGPTAGISLQTLFTPAMAKFAVLSSTP
jgi:hypothetical protein